MMRAFCNMGIPYIFRGNSEVGRLQQLVHANLCSHPVDRPTQPIAITTRSVVQYRQCAVPMLLGPTRWRSTTVNLNLLPPRRLFFFFEPTRGGR